MTGSRWRLIQGGAWIPDQRTISKIQDHIQAYVQNLAAEDDLQLPNWQHFQFAYQGQHTPRHERGMPFVFIAAYWLPPLRAGLADRFHAVPDHGQWHFTVKFRADIDQFFDLHFDHSKPGPDNAR